MKRPTRTVCLLAAACGLAVLLPWSMTKGEVTRTADFEPVPAEQQIEPVPIHNNVVLRTQCWQEGVKIVDQGGLRGIDLNAVTRQRSVSFKRQGEKQPSVFLLPLADALCLVQPER
jgi:hypothetical protein